MRYKKLFNSIKTNFLTKCRKERLFFVKFFYVNKDYQFWKAQKILEIDNCLINPDVWEITLKKIQKLKNKVDFWVVKKAYWNSYIYWLRIRLDYFTNKKTKIEALPDHLDSVKFSYEQEKKRQENIDSKAKQVLSNASIILTIFGTLTALILNQGIVVANRTYSIIGAVVVLVLLLWSLTVAIRVLDFKKYLRPNSSILNPINFDKETFLRDRISRFYMAIEVNTSTNTYKSKKIINATRVLWTALAFVTFLFCYNFLLWKGKDREEPHKIEIVNAVKVNSNCCDTTVRKDSITLIQHLYFKFDQAEMLPDVQKELIKLALYLSRNPTKSIYLIGHADYIGTDEYNRKLSMNRVSAVRNFLLEKGINTNRILIDFKGENVPIDGEHKKVAAGINRRVEYFIK